MAYANAVLIDGSSEVVYAPLGFSWTVALFGSLVPLLRRDYSYFFIVFLLSAVTLGISNLIFASIYNRLFLNKHLRLGFKVSDISDTDKNIFDLTERNPVKYSEQYASYFVWVEVFGFKYMKYFKTKEDAMKFVKKSPSKCLTIKHLYLSINNHVPKMYALKEKYSFPHDLWEHSLLPKK